MRRLLGLVVLGVPLGACAPSASATITPEEEAYVPKVVISKVRKEVVPHDGCYIRGEIKNAGDRTLASVRLKLLYLDKDGKPVGDESALPVRAEGLSFGIPTDGKFLRPGYAKVWEETCPHDLTDEWAGGVSATVETVGFSEREQ